MTRPFKAAEKTAVDVLLEGLTVAEPVIVSPPVVAPPVVVDRYASTHVLDRYASVKGSGGRGRYVGDRYTYVLEETPLPKPARKGVYHRRRPQPPIVLLLPPPPEKVLTDAGYLWLSDNEYQQCYEEQDYESMYPIGAYIDFSEAIQNAFDQRECLGLNENDDYWLYGLPIRGEVDTHKDCECPYCDERIWLSSGLTDQAITLREFLLSEPDEFARSLTSSDRYYIREWSGVLRTPSQDEVLAAVLTDPMHGLGGAALDYAIWNKPEDYGTAGEHMYELIEEVEGENGLTRIPVQSFLFRKDDLHQSTEPVMFEAIPELWRLYGGYAVDKIEYTSDLTGKVAVGWRSCWVRPHGIAVMPEFDDR